MYLYLFPPEARLETQPFFVAPSGAGTGDLLCLPRGNQAVPSAGAGCLVYSAACPDCIRLPDGRKEPVFDFSAAGNRIPERIAGWVRLEPARMLFPLPCPRGCGKPLSRAELMDKITGKAVFYAEPFCCMACVLPEPPAHLILFDTDGTLQKKLRLAETRGADGVLGCLSCGPV